MRRFSRLITIIVAVLAFASILSQMLFVSYAQNSATGIDTKLNSGDVDLNGTISMADVMFIMRYCCELMDLNSIQMINADTNCDGRITTSDAVIVMKYVVGTCDKLPYVSEPVFTNYTFPTANQRVSYNKSRMLHGFIQTQSPIKNIRITVTDIASGNKELDEKIEFSNTSSITSYDTVYSVPSIDSKLKFATLSTGKKNVSVFCTTNSHSNFNVYSQNFYVGFTYSEVAGKVYSGSSTNQSEARKVLALLNSLDYSKENAQIIANGMKYVGSDYSTYDCSKFVRQTIGEALNIQLPRTSYEQAMYCTQNGYDIFYNGRTTGDLLFMSNLECSCGRYHEIHHSAIYLGVFDGAEYLMESTSSLGGVVIRQIWGNDGGKWSIDSTARLWK